MDDRAEKRHRADGAEFWGGAEGQVQLEAAQKAALNVYFAYLKQCKLEEIEAFNNWVQEGWNRLMWCRKEECDPSEINYLDNSVDSSGDADEKGDQDFGGADDDYALDQSKVRGIGDTRVEEIDDWEM